MHDYNIQEKKKKIEKQKSNKNRKKKRKEKLQKQNRREKKKEKNKIKIKQKFEEKNEEKEEERKWSVFFAVLCMQHQMNEVAGQADVLASFFSSEFCFGNFFNIKYIISTSIELAFAIVCLSVFSLVVGFSKLLDMSILKQIYLNYAVTLPCRQGIIIYIHSLCIHSDAMM